MIAEPSIPVLTFFNNKGGVGKTSLVFHLAWMLSEFDIPVLACDLDPQSNLTSAFLDEEVLASLWDQEPSGNATFGRTIFECVEPLTQVGDLRPATIREISSNLSMIPGDLRLSEFEETLSKEWPDALGRASLYRPFRILTSFWTVMQDGARQAGAKAILVDVGPNLGAINRSALIATDRIVVPLAADLFSIQGLKNLGPTLDRWRSDWSQRRDNWKEPEFSLPQGKMRPLGYVMQQHGQRLDRPVRAYGRWADRIPGQYATSLLGRSDAAGDRPPSADPQNCLATVKHYRSLVPMAQEARKPIFHLKPADGAIGNHALAVRDAWDDFAALALALAARAGLTAAARL